MNLLRDNARRAAAEGRAIEKVGHTVPGGLDDAIDSVGRRDELQRALVTLADEEREAIALRFGAELTVPEIAKLLGEPLTTVEGRVYRALRKLRERI
jgi:RNA polymerase sigma-70 factor (ECF subfamily)